MKLLRIQAKGLPLFQNELDIAFYAQQRIYEEDKSSLVPLFSNVFLNPAVSFIGINASGKTSVLNVIQLVTDILNNKSVVFPERGSEEHHHGEYFKPAHEHEASEQPLGDRR